MPGADSSEPIPAVPAMAAGVTKRLPLTHLGLALMVVAIWGTNFVVMKRGLEEFPPFTLTFIRFACATFPLIFFLPRPAMGFGPIAAYGLLIGVGQFGLLFYALAGHVTPGLASLLIQAQAFFTVAMALVLAGEKLRLANSLALALGLGALVLIATQGQGDITSLGLALVLAAAFSWACANLVAKRAGQVNFLSLMVWSSLAAVPPLFLGVILIDGVGPALTAIQTASAAGWAAALWQTVGNTLFGYGVWNWLISRHPAGQIAPLGLMVPVFGLSAAALIYGEALQPWKLAAAAMVITGLIVNVRAGTRIAAPAESGR